LITAGHVSQILLSSDTARKSVWHVHNPRTNGLAHLLLNFVSSLREASVCEKHIHAMLVENPARFLAF